MRASTALPGHRHARWWLAVCLGTLVTVPFAWLLSHVALLPFLLGLFFFALFGLLIGAIVHRTAAAGRPYARGLLMAGTGVMVLVGWGGSIAMEAWDSPRKLAADALRMARSIGELTPVAYQAEVAEHIREYFRGQYPPGGPVGYARWVLAGGELAAGTISGVDAALGAGQVGATWAVRAALSLLLFGFGVGSQTLLLRLERDPPVRRASAA
ncbi:MAG: hypothetical protein HY763_01525 [Planctomycetes bacterium]|nr:hypothetical protein [Planctomycetota bacterium]